MDKAKQTKNGSNKQAKKHKSIMGSLKYAVSLPYKTNAVDLVRKVR